MALFVLYRVSESKRFNRIYRTRKLRGRNDQGEFGVLFLFFLAHLVFVMLCVFLDFIA